MTLSLVKDRIEAASINLTVGERKVAATILADYPYAGLLSIKDLACQAEVSPPSISRFMTKIGLAGYQEFQRQLILEVKDGDRSPVEVQAGERNVEGSILGDFLAKASAEMSFAHDEIREWPAKTADVVLQLLDMDSIGINLLILKKLRHLGQYFNNLNDAYFRTSTHCTLITLSRIWYISRDHSSIDRQYNPCESKSRNNS